ncbi:MAG: zinc-binding dehydrogenase [Bacteriovoracia bacterium]
MRAAVIEQHSSIEDKKGIVFHEKEMPKATANQSVIKVKAIGLNHLDTWVRRGVPGHKFPLPIIPGSDVTGIVESASDELQKRGITNGARVIVNPSVFCGTCSFCTSGRDHLCQKWGLIGETTDGACQEYILAYDNQVYELPAKLSFEQGACIPINYVTAWQMLIGKAAIKKGETILILAAGSGVSVACIQIAKLMGLQIFVTSTSEEKLIRAKNLGAHRFILSTKEKIREAVRNLTSKQGVDVVVDHIAGENLMESIKCLKKGGRLVSCGATAGGDVHIDWKTIFFKNIALLGSTYGPSSDFIEVLNRFDKGELVPLIDSVFSFDEIQKAHEWLMNRKSFGKVVLKMPS